jgi:hypothetical protein
VYFHARNVSSLADYSLRFPFFAAGFLAAFEPLAFRVVLLPIVSVATSSFLLLTGTITQLMSTAAERRASFLPFEKIIVHRDARSGGQALVFRYSDHLPPLFAELIESERVIVARGDYFVLPSRSGLRPAAPACPAKSHQHKE